ncbi:MAG: hypothetical protein JWQ76_2376 [Ramlibacter sp.]|nr:hypothetical protein [Ramlibacter sp.]
MKYILAVLAAAACVVASAQPAQRVADLRRVLEQYHPASAPHPQPRQLTPEERAQLRRQLADFKQPAATRPPDEGPTTR